MKRITAAVLILLTLPSCGSGELADLRSRQYELTHEKQRLNAAVNNRVGERRWMVEVMAAAPITDQEIHDNHMKAVVDLGSAMTPKEMENLRAGAANTVLAVSELRALAVAAKQLKEVERRIAALGEKP